MDECKPLSNGQLMGDLWALRGVMDSDGGNDDGGGAAGGGGATGGGEDSTPRWTRLQLRGAGPSARAGHCVTAAGPYVVVMGRGSHSSTSQLNWRTFGTHPLR